MGGSPWGICLRQVAFAMFHRDRATGVIALGCQAESLLLSGYLT